MPAAIPPSVANANAQLTSADAPDSARRSARPTPSCWPPRTSPPTRRRRRQVVAADQLNDLDRALQQNQTHGSRRPMASAGTPAAPRHAGTVAALTATTWDQTSLIGKIFIAFGGLLTLASAARMFMA